MTLAAPDQADLLYCTKIWAGFDVDEPDYEAFPLARRAHFVELEISAGEMLFLPEAWFHYVRSVTTSMSLNFWTVHSRGIFDAGQK